MKVTPLRQNPTNREESPDLSEDIAAILENWISENYGDGGGDFDSAQTPTYYRHQLLNPDFWFFSGGWTCILLIFTSFIPSNAFEPLLFAGFILTSLGLVANLTREKAGILLHETRKAYAINLRFPRWTGFGYVPPSKPLVERIDW